MSADTIDTSRVSLLNLSLERKVGLHGPVSVSPPRTHTRVGVGVDSMTAASTEEHHPGPVSALGAPMEMRSSARVTGDTNNESPLLKAESKIPVRAAAAPQYLDPARRPLREPTDAMSVPDLQNTPSGKPNPLVSMESQEGPPVEKDGAGHTAASDDDVQFINAPMEYAQDMLAAIRASSGRTEFVRWVR